MNISVIACHPDDEVLGCGGTIALYARRGSSISLLHLTKGIASRNSSDAKYHQARLSQATSQSSSILGITSTHNLDLPDNQLDTVPFLEIVQAVESFISLHEPQIVFTHFHGDLNIDHQTCNKAVLTACRPLPGSYIKSILGFEVLSSTEWNPPNTFIPHVYHDISASLSAKNKALQAYDTEMRPFPHSRSFETVSHLAYLRGSQAGLEAAEAFYCYRQINL